MITFAFQATDPSLSNLPSSTSIELPPIAVRGEYLVNVSSIGRPPLSGDTSFDQLEPGVASTFLKAIVDIGHLEQNLTTDLLNQLIFLQKGFIKVLLISNDIYIYNFIVSVCKQKRICPPVTQKPSVLWQI